MRCALVGEIAQSVMVVEVEAHTEFLAGIDTKLGMQVVFAVLLVATLVVADVGKGRQGVEKQELVRLYRRKGVGLCEIELADMGTVNEDTAHTGCIVVAGGIILTIETSIVDAVLIKMGNGVDISRNDIAETTVNPP